jgi:hypothetical protein
MVGFKKRVVAVVEKRNLRVRFDIESDSCLGSHRGFPTSSLYSIAITLHYRMSMDGLADPTSLRPIDSQSSLLEGQNFLHFHQFATFTSIGLLLTE